MNKRFYLSIILILSLSALLPAQKVSTSSLLNEMIDLETLANYPDQDFRTIQYSSHDHRSKYPDYPGWFENADGFGNEPIPGFEKVLKDPDENGIGEYLICDVDGPGAIVRLWTAWIEGEIEMYIDEQDEPIYKGPAQKFFQHTYEALAEKELVASWKETFAQNTAGYYPIPFSKKLKLIWRGDLRKLHFYHVQIRFYAPETKVVSFTQKDIERNSKLLEKIAAVLAEPSSKLDGALKDAPAFVERIKPGEKKLIAKVKGAQAISRLASHITAQDIDLALRQTLLDIRFDGAPWGQVQSPLGDFFGAAPGINPYESLPFSVFHDGRMVCRFYMPFRDSVEVYVENKGEQEVTLNLKLVMDDHTWKEDESMYFRARWRADHELHADPAAVYDIPYLLYRGKGRMVGAAAFIMNPTNIPSSYGNWWGEGDEKIFIDNELYPAFIGTGSEDYFNYAWSSSAIFTHAYCGQPRNDGPANRGFVTNYRWHILDNVLFEKGFDFYMELYTHRIVSDVSYARTVYLYGGREGHDDHLPISTADVQMPKMPENWWPTPEGWAANAIFYQCEDLISPHYATREVHHYMWSAKKLLVWKPKVVGEELKMQFPVSEAGKYMLGLTVAKMPVSGTIEIFLDGELVKFNGQDKNELSKPFRTVSRNLKSGTLDLSEGTHQLSIKSVDEKRLPIGLDFIWVKKQ